MISKDTKKQIEKEILNAIEETGITTISRELLDDKRICYLVLTSQLLGLRQGYECSKKEILERIEREINDVFLKARKEGRGVGDIWEELKKRLLGEEK